MSTSESTPILPRVWQHISENAIYRFTIDRELDEVRCLRELLSSDECTRADRYYSEQLRSRYIVARGTLRILLAHTMGEAPESLIFTYGSHGKPAIIGGPSFNLSHSEGLALAAIGRSGDLGIDVEWQDPSTMVEEIAERFFTPQECSEIMALTTTEKRHELFFDLWCCKESYLKAVGTGISAGLNTCRIVRLKDGGIRIENPLDPAARSRFMIYRLDPGEGFSGALCLENTQ